MQYLCGHPQKLSVSLPYPTYDAQIEEKGPNEWNHKHYEHYRQPANQDRKSLDLILPEKSLLLPFVHFRFMSDVWVVRKGVPVVVDTANLNICHCFQTGKAV